MPFDWAGTPRQCDAGFDSLVVLTEPCSKALHGFQRTGSRPLQPGIEALGLALADQGRKVLREVNGFGDLGMVRVELGELLGLGLGTLCWTPQHQPCCPAGR